jgi:alpha-beta hydrolase superfamily lysophospholipase
MKQFAKKLVKGLLILFLFLNVIVLFHAYKFTHFYEPNEIVLKKKEQKTGWDITKEILMGSNFAKQRNSAPDSAFKTIILTTADGLKLEAWEKKMPGSKGSVAIFHGHGSKKSSMLQESTVFSSLGYNILLLDFRAHGGSQGNTCTIGYDEAEDVKLAYDQLRSEGEKNIILFGASLGAATITKSISDYKLAPSKVILDMPFASLTDAVKGRLKIMKLPAEPLGSLLTFWGGTTHGFWAFNHNPYEYVRKIKCPVLLQRGQNDERVTQEETEKIYANISSPKKLVIYQNSAHESLCKKETAKWTSEVTAFLQ